MNVYPLAFTSTMLLLIVDFTKAFDSIHKQYFLSTYIKAFAQSAGAVEYTDGFSAEG